MFRRVFSSHTNLCIPLRLFALTALVFGVVAIVKGAETLASPAAMFDENQFAVNEALRLLAYEYKTTVDRFQLLTVARSSSTGFLNIKALRRESGTIVDLSVDDTGMPVDPVIQEQLRLGTRSRLHPALALELKKRVSSDARKIPVLIWARSDVADTTARSAWLEVAQATGAERQAMIAELHAQRADSLALVTAPLRVTLTRFDAGTATASDVPVLYARLTGSQIRDVDSRPDVLAIDGAVRYEPALDVAVPGLGGDTVKARGLTGRGTSIGIIEVQHGPDPNNPFVAGIVQDPQFACSTPSEHSMAVTGIVKSSHPTYEGLAPDATVRVGGSCMGMQNEIMDRSAAATDWGAQVINLSCGANIGRTPGIMERYYDAMVMNRLVSVVVAAGNEPCRSGDVNVTSPAIAYNVISVGNVDDKNTISWTDDSIDYCSSWRNPTSRSGDREKPEVAAPGTNIISTTIDSPWISLGPSGGFSGTSVAAPMVTGIIGLLLQRDPELRLWPEAVKAIVMTSAMHNVEGNPRLSEYEGAGTIVADRADDIATLHTISGPRGWNALPYDCEAPLDLDAATMALSAGERTRATIAWNQNPNYMDYAQRPSADLDLMILDVNNAVVAWSASYDNTFEIVDFAPTAAGTYVLRIHKKRCDLTPHAVGFAWSAGP